MCSATDKQLFWGRLSDKVHATTLKGIVGGFEFTVFQRNLKEWQNIHLQVVKEINKSRFNSYSARNSVLIISHITFWDSHMHIFSNNSSRNSCMYVNSTNIISTSPKKKKTGCLWLERIFYLVWAEGWHSVTRECVPTQGGWYWQVHDLAGQLSHGRDCW